MNRLGMIVDISHVSTKKMEDVLEVSKAPVMFSHSSVYQLCNHIRNVKDHVLDSLVNFCKIIVCLNLTRIFSIKETKQWCYYDQFL